MKNKMFINILGLVIILLPIISCSGSSQKKVLKEESKTQNKTEIVNANMPQMSKTTCTDCHKSNEKGELSFRNKQGILEFKQKTKEASTSKTD